MASPVRPRVWGALLALVLLFALGLPSAAFAASTYFDKVPAAGSVSTLAKPLVSVRVSDPAGITGGFQMKVDGVSRTPKVTPGAGYTQLSYQTTVALKNGAHTAYASVYTGAGRTSTTWSFTTKAPPVVSALAPAAGSTTAQQRPTVSAVVIPNGVALAFFSMEVDGAPVAATYTAGTKTVAYTPASPLANDRTHTASLVVTDVTGATTTVAWAFDVQIYGDMSDATACADCHAGYPDVHPMTNCDGCHNAEGPEPAYFVLDPEYLHSSDYLAVDECAYCHSGSWPGVPVHAADVGTSHETTTDMSGCVCHTRSLTVEHNRRLTEAGGTITCATCHASEDATVAAAILAGATGCADCHTIPPGHPYADVDHVADVSATQLDATGKTCGDCHAMDLATEHAKASSSSTPGDCATCHPMPRDSFPAWGQGCSQGGCHASGGPTEMHGQMGARHAVPAVPACAASGCHDDDGDLAGLHTAASTTVEGDVRTSCSICHAAGVTPTNDCSTCHTDKFNPDGSIVSHGFDPLQHTADETETPVAVGSPVTCGDCHEMLINAEHDKPASSTTGGGCATCHPTARGTIPGAWNQSCADGGCHTPAASDPQHSGAAAGHAVRAANDGCFGAECHVGTDLAAMHSDATTSVAGVDRASCLVCHTPPDLPTWDCETCHPDRLVPHGYEPALHLSNEACLGSCHSVELKPEHDSLVSPVVCSGCHATKVDEITPWDKTCGACHEIIEHSTADHTGTDAAVRASRSYGYGCSDTDPNQLNCHDISNVSALHFPMPGKGCAVCHGPGKTPARECRTCHPQNSPPTSQAFSTTYYPEADGPVVGTTVMSAGTARWNLVDEPNPGDADGTYFQFQTPGSAMFSSTHAIPTSATITSVVVYARARSTAATTRNYYPMFSVGGTNYQRTPTNISSSYTAGAGVSYSMTTNPKRGGAWQPADLNSTGGAYTLDYFGVGNSNVSGTIYLRVTQCYLVVNYTLPIEVPEGALLGTTWYHHNNVKYLYNASDAAPGAYYAASPPSGWNDALFYQDCYDFCHHDTATGPPVFTAYDGDWMWYSTAGAYFPETRTLTLESITVPADAPTLQFMTNWRMSGTDAGYVEISTDGGSNWAPMTGTVGGVSRASLSGDAVDWVPATYDLAAYAGQSVKIRFRFFVNDGAEGWAFDSLTVNDSTGPVFTDDAETLKPEWNNYHWTRSMGAYPFF